MHSNMTTPRYSDAQLDQLAADLNRDGICVIRNLFSKGLLEEWAKAFDRLFKSKQNVPGGLAPREQARYYLTLPWIAPFANVEVFANPVILGVLDRVFAHDFVMVQMAADVPLQGSAYQDIHRDHPPLFSDQIVTPLYTLAVNFPLVDVTEKNGPFEMARGTHALPREEGLQKIHGGELSMESFLLKMGDVMIRTPLALHRGTPNLTSDARPMVVMGYVRGWLHTPNVELTLPRDYYESLPERVKNLLRCRVVEQLPDGSTENYLNFKF